MKNKITLTLFIVSAFLAQLNAQIFNAGFENNNGTPLSEFTTINNDGLLVPSYAPVLEFNTEAWIQFYDGYDNKIAFSTSYYDPAGQSDDWLITPAIAIPASGDPTLYWKAKSYDFENLEDYEIRVSTTNNEMESFQDILLTVIGEQPFDYNSRFLDLSDYKGQTIYLAFVNITYNGYYLALDDLYISESADCILPNVEDVSVSDLTESSFTVDWTATPNVSVYDTGLTTFSVPVTSSGTQTDLSKTYSGLEPGTRYQFFLKNADCGSGWATPTSIWTPALPPYSYDFEYSEENYGEYDSDGWTSNTWLNGFGDSAQNGTGYVFNNTSTSFAKDDWIYSYPIKINAGETLLINFYAQLGSTTADPVILKVAAATSPNKAANFEELDSHIVSPGDYEAFQSSFTASETGVYYFGFGNVNPIVSESAALRLDNVQFSLEELSTNDAKLSKINIYPNPVENYLFIDSNETIKVVEVYSINGKLMASLSNVDKIDFSSFSEGIYLIKLITTNGSEVKKVIK